MTTGSVHAFDPLAESHLRDPYPAYERLREQPAVWVESLGAWFVGRHKDIMDCVRDPVTFSNRDFERVSKGEFTPVPEATSLLSTDPPDHTRLRRLASVGFRPSRTRALEPDILAYTDRRLDECLAQGDEFDFQQDFADPIPVDVISRLIGADPERGTDFKRWTSDILSAGMRSTMNAEQLAQIRRSVDEAREYFGELIEERRAERGNDIISAFLDAEDDGGDVLTTGEILGLSILLLIGGDETTAHLLGNTLVLLWNNPEQLALIREKPDLMSNLIEESLRYEAPVQTGFLTTTRDVDIDGVEIPADSHLIVVWGSANRDPAAFRDPDAFDITRDTQSHMAFGFGPHSCLGATLARTEARVILPRLLERMPNLQPADPHSPLDWIPSYWIRGLHTLKVRP
jgi:cytochrome P450 family 109